MRPTFINEKFDEISDPVVDMGIGGFVPFDMYNRMIGPLIKKWEKIVRDSIEGKTLQGHFLITATDSTGPNFKVFVTEVHFYSMGYIEVERPDGTLLGLIGDEKYKVIG